MAKNLIQRMQGGGQLQPRSVYSHQPIVLEEAPELWETIASAAGTFFDPEETRADRLVDLEEDELNFRKIQGDRNYELAQDTLDIDRQRSIAEIRSSNKRNEIERDKLNADILQDSTEGLDWKHRAAIATELDSPLGDTYGVIAGDYASAEGGFNKAVNAGDSKEANKILRENYNLFKTNSKDLESKERSLHGLFALQALPSLISMPGVKDLVGQSQFDTWKNARTPEDALRYLNQFIPVIGAAGALNKERYEALKNIGSVLSTLSTAAVDSGSQALVDALNEKIPTYMNQLSRFLGPQDFKTDDQKKDTVDYKFITAGTDDPKTTKDERVRIALDPSKTYSVQYKDVEGKQHFSTMKGSQIDKMEKQEGIKIKSTKEIFQILSRSGVPNIEPGTKVMDLAGNKILTFKGMKTAPAKKGISVKTGIAGAGSPYGEAKYMYFEDSSGKLIKYTLGQVYKKKFALTSGVPKGAPQPMQQDRIAGGGLQIPTQSAFAGQPPEASPTDSLQSLQDVFDTYENIIQ